MVTSILLAAIPLYVVSVAAAAFAPASWPHSQRLVGWVAGVVLAVSLGVLAGGLLLGDWRDRGTRWETHGHAWFWIAVAVAIAAIAVASVATSRRFVPFRAGLGLLPMLLNVIVFLMMSTD